MVAEIREMWPGEKNYFSNYDIFLRVLFYICIIQEVSHQNYRRFNLYITGILKEAFHRIYSRYFIMVFPMM